MTVCGDTDEVTVRCPLWSQGEAPVWSCLSDYMDYHIQKQNRIHYFNFDEPVDKRSVHDYGCDFKSWSLMERYQSPSNLSIIRSGIILARPRNQFATTNYVAKTSYSYWLILWVRVCQVFCFADHIHLWVSLKPLSSAKQLTEHQSDLAILLTLYLIAL